MFKDAHRYVKHASKEICWHSLLALQNPARQEPHWMRFTTAPRLNKGDILTKAKVEQIEIGVTDVQTLKTSYPKSSICWKTKLMTYGTKQPGKWPQKRLLLVVFWNFQEIIHSSLVLFYCNTLLLVTVCSLHEVFQIAWVITCCFQVQTYKEKEPRPIIRIYKKVCKTVLLITKPDS